LVQNAHSSSIALAFARIDVIPARFLSWVLFMQQYQQLIKVKSQNMSKLSDFDAVGKISVRANKFEPGKKKGGYSCFRV
jgi:hypothetical protein